MKRIRTALLPALLVLVGSVSTVAADPIVYNGTLAPGVTVFGAIFQPNGSPSDPVGAEYWDFFAIMGSAISIAGDRVPTGSGYDMSLWVMPGVFADTGAFGGDLGSIAGAIFGDDQDPDPGPFGDPRVDFIASVTGSYTIAVTNFFSNTQPPHNYSLVARGIQSPSVPEPATLLLLGTGLAMLGIRRRRQTKSAGPIALEAPRAPGLSWIKPRNR